MSRNTDKLKILKKSREFSVVVCRVVEHFNKSYKYTIGDRVVLHCENLREHIIDANREIRPDKAAEFVYSALRDLDQIEDKFKMALALGLMSIDQQAMLNEMIDDIRGDARGWRSYFLKKKTRDGRNDDDLPPDSDSDGGPSPESL